MKALLNIFPRRCVAARGQRRCHRSAPRRAAHSAGLCAPLGALYAECPPGTGSGAERPKSQPSLHGERCSFFPPLNLTLYIK